MAVLEHKSFIAVRKDPPRVDEIYSVRRSLALIVSLSLAVWCAVGGIIYKVF